LSIVLPTSLADHPVALETGERVVEDAALRTPEQGHAVGAGVYAGVRDLGALGLDVQRLEDVHLVLVPGVHGADRQAHDASVPVVGVSARARIPVRLGSCVQGRTGGHPQVSHEAQRTVGGSV